MIKKAYKILHNIIRYAMNPMYRFSVNNELGLDHNIPDREFICRQFYLRTGRKLNLSNPKTFSEKIQWLKLYDRKPEYTMLVDKYTVKSLVADCIGKQHVIPTYGVWNNLDDIEWRVLPNQFVLKCTHDSGGIYIVRDKKNLNITQVREKLEPHLKRNYYYAGREWAYKNIRPRILAEKYMQSAEKSADLRDYKFYCFHGKPMYCQVISNRNTFETVDFFDMNWIHQNFTGLALPYKPFSPSSIPAPKCFSDMQEIACKLSKDLIFARIDLYDIHDFVYFGEITFYPAAGNGEFSPVEWNTKLGNLIQLPDSVNETEC